MRNFALQSSIKIVLIAPGVHLLIYSNLNAILLQISERSRVKRQEDNRVIKAAQSVFVKDRPEEVISHIPEVCTGCGGSLEKLPAERGQVHQVIDIRIPPRVLTNHCSMIKRCSCGTCNKGTFPIGVRGRVNYGPNIRALLTNLSVRQYIPYGRIVEILEDLYKIHISEGTVANIITRFASDCANKIENI